MNSVNFSNPTESAHISALREHFRITSIMNVYNVWKIVYIAMIINIADFVLMDFIGTNHLISANLRQIVNQDIIKMEISA